MTISKIELDKFYMVDVDENVVLQAGPFTTLEEGEDFATENGINLISNDNPYSIWEGQAVAHYGTVVRGTAFKISSQTFEEYDDFVWNQSNPS